MTRDEMAARLTDEVLQAVFEAEATGYINAVDAAPFGEKLRRGSEGAIDAARKVLLAALQPSPASARELQELKALSAYIEWHGAMHTDDCPCDDTCDCPKKWINDGINALHRRLSALPALEPPPQERPDGTRILEWLDESPRRPPHVAFTAGAERQIAYWIEVAESRKAEPPPAAPGETWKLRWRTLAEAVAAKALTPERRFLGEQMIMLMADIERHVPAPPSLPQGAGEDT